MRQPIALVALALAGCGATFEVPVSGTTTVPAGNLVTCSVLPAFQGFGGFDISQTQQFQNQGATKQNVQSVKVQSIELKSTNPAGAGLGFFDSISFYAEDPSGQLPKVEIAHTASGSFGGDPASVSMQVDGAELAPYAELPQMNLSASAKLASCPPQDTTVEADIVLSVSLKGL
ncbi:MAG: hypothetical protein ACYCWW_06650 [Deltaproteobacteria bacterium]